MGKRVAAKEAEFSKAKGTLRVTVLTVVAALVIGGPSALHYIWGMGLSPVLTSSMVPYAEPGDLLVSMPIKAQELKVGDVISVHNPESGSSYAHRVIEVADLGSMLKLVTKGDANPTPELAPVIVKPDTQVPREILSIKWLGAPLLFLSSSQGQQASISLLVVANLGVIYFLFQRRTKLNSPTAARKSSTATAADKES